MTREKNIDATKMIVRVLILRHRMMRKTYIETT